FKDSTAGWQITVDDTQMVPQRSQLRRLVRDVIDVFPSFKIVLLVILLQFLRRKTLIHGHQSAIAADDKTPPPRRPGCAVAAGAGWEIRRIFHDKTLPVVQHAGQSAGG